MGDDRCTHSWRKNCRAYTCGLTRGHKGAHVSSEATVALAERAAVVAWLRDHARLSFEGVVHIDAERMALANAIERGEHVRPPPVAAEEG